VPLGIEGLMNLVNRESLKEMGIMIKKTRLKDYQVYILLFITHFEGLRSYITLFRIDEIHYSMPYWNDHSELWSKLCINYVKLLWPLILSNKEYES
jgi:hypothetical protein